jgi:putative redox protein
MSLKASAHSVSGSLRQEVTVDGRFRLVTDEPASLGGEDTAPSPHELLPAALAACVSTQLVLYARAKGWELGRVAVAVDYDHKARPPHCTVDVRVDEPLSPEQVARLEKVAAGCPVRRVLEGGIEFEERLTAGCGQTVRAA